MKHSTKHSTWYQLVIGRGISTYRNGKLDFTHGEGGNHHIHAFDNTGAEAGYIWFDNHCGYFGFCGKGTASCNGIFRAVLMGLYPDEWEKPDCLFRFTEEMFNRMMDVVKALLQ